VTDPIFGDTPLDGGQLWDQVWLRPLYTDPYWQGWRNVLAEALGEFYQSQWLMRWRRALVFAEGTQLLERGFEIAPNFPQPDGWNDERYRDVLIAMVPGVVATPTPAVLVGIAEALVEGGQTFVCYDEPPLSQRVSFFDVAIDDATNYLAALSRARPNGGQIFLTVHPDLLTAFTIGTSTIGGFDTLGTILVT
jgi:hypothetical protein